MALSWNFLGVSGVLIGFMAWVLAATVYFSRPQRSQNRRLAVLLAIEGVFNLASFYYLVPERNYAYAWMVVGTASVPLLLPLYLYFLATIDVPLVRPFRSKLATVVLGVFAAAGVAAVFWRPNWFVAQMYRPTYGEWEILPGYGLFVFSLAILLVFVFGLLASISLLRHTPRGTADRRKATAFALAFGSRDASILFIFLMGFFSRTRPLEMPSNALLALTIQEVGFLCLYLFMSYGILRVQLFDIDMKIKWTIRQSTIAAVFVAVFVGVSAGMQDWIGQSQGVILGGLAAGLLVFFLAPLQRFADRLAAAAMPNARPAAERARTERLQFYEDAARDAWADGTLNRRERALLDRLHASLGLTANEVLRIEARAARPPPRARSSAP